ncbi:hypothetical protein ACFW92_15735, partial [Streptomyces scopuliridis]|uniref:hypothetical protein n=1 Tax=Streptomyces scopuliridis TaxID=452529 RepID=UPI00369D9C16
MPEHDTSDLPNAPFDPWPTTHLHVEWGSQAAQLAADRGDTVVGVDTLTFSTTERESPRVDMQVPGMEIATDLEPEGRPRGWALTSLVVDGRDGRPLEYGRGWSRPDAFNMRMEYQNKRRTHRAGTSQKRELTWKPPVLRQAATFHPRSTRLKRMRLFGEGRAARRRRRVNPYTSPVRSNSPRGSICLPCGPRTGS